MKEYKLKFGISYGRHYNNDIWHVAIVQKIPDFEEEYRAYCDHNIFMGFVYTTKNTVESSATYIYPITDGVDIPVYANLNYKILCKICKKKFKVTQEDINHYLVLAKFGIKI